MVTVDDDDGPDSPKNLLNHLSLVPSPAIPDKMKRLHMLLRNHPILSRLAPDCLNRVFNEFMLSEYNRGDIVFRKDDPDDRFYVVEKGFCIDPEHDNVNAPKSGIGATFGDISLVHPGHKRHTVQAICELSMWSIEGSLFRFMVSSHSLLQFERLKGLVDHHAKHLALHLPRDVSYFVDFSSLIEVKQGGNIFDSPMVNMAPADFVIFIQEGTVELCTLPGVQPADRRLLGPGGVFGETLLPTFLPGQYVAVPTSEWAVIISTRTQVYTRLPHLRGVLSAAALGLPPPQQ